MFVIPKIANTRKRYSTRLSRTLSQRLIRRQWSSPSREAEPQALFASRAAPPARPEQRATARTAPILARHDSCRLTAGSRQYTMERHHHLRAFAYGRSDGSIVGLAPPTQEHRSSAAT